MLNSSCLEGLGAKRRLLGSAIQQGLLTIAATSKTIAIPKTQAYFQAVDPLAEHALDFAQPSIGGAIEVVQEGRNRDGWYMLDITPRGEVGKVVCFRETRRAWVVRQAVDLQQNLAVVLDVLNHLQVVRALQRHMFPAWGYSQRYDCSFPSTQVSQLAPSNHPAAVYIMLEFVTMRARFR